MNTDRVILDQGELSALNRLYSRVYSFVALGIGISAIVSYLTLTVFREPVFNTLFSPGGSLLLWAAIIGELVLVGFASAAAVKNRPNALPLFLGYSVLNGFTLSITLAFYDLGSIASAFVAAAVMFVSMAVWGARTKRDLSGMARACYAGLIGLIVVSLINLFLGNTGLDFLIPIIGVLIFAGLIAYDNQRIREVFYQSNGQVQEGWIVSLALGLYLDFINIFLYLLRIFGDRD